MPRFLRSWNEAEIETVVKMWATGMRALLIGRMIGKSKNAVIGQAHRMNLPKRGKGSGAGRPRRVPIDKRLLTPKERAARAREREARIAAATPRPPPEQPTPLMVGILDLKPTHCKFPIGDPKGAGFGFCGAGPYQASPYCEYHHVLAYQPVKPRARREAVPA